MNQVTRPVRVEEDARLAALAAFDILDTPPERGFDDIVHLARRLCAAPVALVSLVDRDRQWFKARAGFPPCETDLDRSVCKFVLSEPGVLQIPDLTRDARTRANPLVTGEPNLRFYAGAPLRTPDGQVLGSLCVIDHVPRPGGLSTEQVADLEALARQVMDQLLLRRSRSDRDRAGRQGEAVAVTLAGVAAAGGDLDESFRAVLAGAMRAVPAAEAGTVEIREGDTLVYRAVTESLAPHLGLRVPLRGSLAGACYREGVPLLVPDVLSDDRVDPELAERLRQRSCMLVPVRRGGVVVGVLKLQSSRLGAFAEEDLQVLGVLAGSVASGLAEAGERAANRAAALTEYRRRAVFDSAQDYAIILLDLDGRITDWNAGATRILGWRPEEMCGETADAFFTPEDRRDGIPAKEMQSALETGTGVDERWHLRRDGERF
ncbi:GAF domain-containing protein [Methylorubrum sp. POS3]|uniref:GAF domain-containing protein n=1 Tax=Methylorubrum sp. POS3 TaxID=2998492 RepID=UPI00372CEA31